jgi:hypothetical protein
MTPLVWANFPVALLFILAWSSIPLWMVLKHPGTLPSFAEAHAYLAAKTARAAAASAASAPELEPERVSA